VIPEEWHMGKILPSYLKEAPARVIQENGVDCIKGTNIAQVTSDDGQKLKVKLDNGRDLEVVKTDRALN
jgi:hypothetical protein